VSYFVFCDIFLAQFYVLVEIMLENVKYTEKVDVWSFGMLLSFHLEEWKWSLTTFTSILRGERRCASVKRILVIQEVASPHYTTAEALKEWDPRPLKVPEFCSMSRVLMVLLPAPTQFHMITAGTRCHILFVKYATRRKHLPFQ